jgi:hypothetical protein
MGANANAIKNFNKNAQQQQQADAAASQFLGKNTATPDPNAQPVALNSKMSASDITLLQADVTTLSDEQKLRRKALETKVNLKQIEDAKAATQKQIDDQVQEDGDQRQILANELSRGLRAAGDSKAKAWFENVPAPGGIAVLLLIISIFLLAVVPIDSSGHTRLMLMWLTLTGKTHLDYGANSNGSSGDFSATTPATPAPVQGQPAPVAPTPIALSFPTVDLGLTGFFNL